MRGIKKIKFVAQQLSSIRYFGKSTTIQQPGWFDKGSSNLSDTRPHGTEIYELAIDDVKPECWKKYLKHKGEIKSLQTDKGVKVEVLNSWKCVAGDIKSRSVQLLKYPKGWSDIDENSKITRSDPKFEEADEYANTLINNQSTEILKSYNFWPLLEVHEKDHENIYEISSYTLNPGSMYDWTNYWAKGLKCRQSVREDIAYAGLFTQLGQLQTVYHIWRYKDYMDRSKCRKLTWQQDDWSDIVATTGALVTTMKSAIVVPIKIT